jgi:putrescine transport system permease protein
VKLRRPTFTLTVLAFGIAFLYVPIFSVVVYSFNDSAISSGWAGFSLRWYRDLFTNTQALEALWLSVTIAIVSATFATLLGTFAGLALTRFRKFRGRTLFSGMIAAPLVMPEVITGLSLLLFFIALEGLIGWPMGRGATTITLAHITFSMAFVAVIIQARLAGQDEALEEAANDLGAGPFRVLIDITLPLLAPGMIAGWLLAFTLSLDDLVIASFVSGPGANTLPMYIFSKVKLGVKPDINALASMIIAFVAIGVSIAAVVIRRNTKDRPSAD